MKTDPRLSMSSASPHRRTAFTLIELLAVIAIVSLLAAILFPVFAAAREKARQTACMNNMKQLGLGMAQYENDFDETLPGCTDGSSGVNQLGGWVYMTAFSSPQSSFDVTRGALYPYVRAQNVYYCPDDTAAQAESGTPLSYALNGCDLASPTTKTATMHLCAGLPLSKFSTTSDTALLVEEAAGPSLVSCTQPMTGTTDDGYFCATEACMNCFSWRHTNGQTVLYLDKHAKWLSFQQLLIQNTASGTATYTYTVLTGSSGSAGSCPPG